MVIALLSGVLAFVVFYAICFVPFLALGLIWEFLVPKN